MSARAQTGLTLIEVLVAFAILAGLVVSVMALVGQNARFLISAEERLLGQIAIDNLLTEELARLETPRVGEERGAVTVAGRELVWIRTVTEIGASAVQIEYRTLREENGQTLARGAALKAAGS